MTDTASGIPASVIAALNGQHWFVAATDIRPEDAKYATYRALQPCGAAIYRQPFDQILRQTYGLGYSNGTSFTDDFGTGYSYHVRDFNISGNDPLNPTGVAPNYSVSTVGAQPIIVAVSPFGSDSGLDVSLANDIPGFVAANFFSGVLARASDLLSGAAPFAVSALVREPLSGIYNAFEYGIVNNSQYHLSQDIGNCAPGNPLHIVSANGAGLEGGGVQAFRRRVIGTAQMQVQLSNGTQPDERIGYFFWSAANVAHLYNVKYLTVNGVDPIQDNYSNGALPSSTAHGDPCGGGSPYVICPAGLITFKGLNSGDYPLWSALRIVSQSPTPGGVTALISTAQTVSSSLFDFVPASSLKVWRSHYSLPAINVTQSANGPNIAGGNDLCNPTVGALVEQGGDAGGAIILKQANADFCSDYNNNTGLISKTQ
jgi:hypothetical protein